MFHKCSDKCLCASTPGQPGGEGDGALLLWRGKAGAN